MSAVLGLALTIGMARILGDSGAGLVFQAMSVFAIVLALAKFGLDSTAIWFLPRVAVSNASETSTVVSTMVLLTIAISTGATIVAQLIVPWIWAGQPEVAAVVRAATWFVPAGAVMLVMGAALRVVGNVRSYVLLGNIALPAIRLPLVLISAASASSLVTVTLAWAAPSVLVAVLLVVAVARWLRPTGLRYERGSLREHAPTLVRFAAPRTVSAGLEQTLQWLDVLIVGSLVGPAAAGVYGGASRFVQAGLVIDSALRVVVGPRLSALLHKKDSEGVQELYGLASVWLVLFASPLYVVLGLYAPVVLKILGSDFEAGAAALGILCVGAAVTFLAGNVHSVLLMSGRSGWAAFNKGVVVAVNIAGNLVLVPVWGLTGAAAAWALSMLLDALLASVQVRAFIGLRFQAGQVLLALGVTLGSFGVAGAVARGILGSSWLALGVTLVVGGGAYLIGCMLFRRRLRLDGLRAIVGRRPSAS
ncbi:MAG: polysaccharide biosynthesis C-terminal domain-containing protein [Tessaracoccus sp.]|nr:polysaccharide biosynthesis C-terminal domain-containing protein [Tessaracoccus sp.]